MKERYCTHVQKVKRDNLIGVEPIVTESEFHKYLKLINFPKYKCFEIHMYIYTYVFWCCNSKCYLIYYYLSWCMFCIFSTELYIGHRKGKHNICSIDTAGRYFGLSGWMDGWMDVGYSVWIDMWSVCVNGYSFKHCTMKILLIICL